jgi:amino acid adenylation domain-containing protein
MTDPSQSFAGLSLPEKRMLLAELLREKTNQTQPVYPLSQGQRGLWYLYQTDRTSPAYNISFPCQIRSRLDLVEFRRVMQVLVDRHSALRTTFEEHGGELFQRVHVNVPVALDVTDATSWAEETLRGRLEEEVHRPFDLERGPLLRMHLFTRAANEHIFLVVAHHIVGDFWSLVLIMEDIRTLYRVDRGNRDGDDGRERALPPLTSTYRDFVRWQADMLAGPEGQRLGAYWERQLQGVTPVLQLATDRPRPPQLTHRGGAARCRLDPKLTRQLKELAAREHVTLYTVLLAAFQVLLGRYSGQDDFVVGSPFACRSRPEFAGIVGYFINMLPLRANLSGDPTFRTLLRQTGATILEALEHQDYPFPMLVERVRAWSPDYARTLRDTSRTPLFQAAFTLEKAHLPAQVGAARFFLPGTVRAGAANRTVRPSGSDLQTEPYPVQQRTCSSDLEMVLEEGDGAIEGMLRYGTDLFDTVTIERMVGHYQTLLGGLAADPDSRLSRLPLLTEQDRRQVVHEWNQTAADYPQDLCLHQLFEQQAARAPAAVALSRGDWTLSYGQLDAWANRLGQRLRRLGVGPGTLVALCLERSPEMVASILATLKSGAAFVPLDPASPGERMRAILDDVQTPVILTQSHLANRLREITDCRIEIVDWNGPYSFDTQQVPICPSVRPSDLAYVIYTSGSTGQPKGVMVEHRAVCNTVWWHQQVLTVREEDRVLLMVPYFFDAALCIIGPALAGGARLVLAEPGEEFDPSRLLERVAHEGVTILPIPPRVLGLMLDGPFRQACQAVRLVFCGGEPMPPELPARLFDRLDVPVYNLYGPTEAAIDATYWACRRDDPRRVIPIGRPIANVQVYVLDSHMLPVPVGVPGELYIGGAGLARGYLNDPRLTAERFLPNPFSSVPGARLYRTGDSGRWLAEGSVEFLGRLDQQVKLRGYRIELGEIEAALAEHPAVREAAVTVHTDAAGEQRLVAYVVGQEEGRPPAADVLRRHLKEKLPDYMTPSTFVSLPALPHTTTGKVDRKALPDPVRARPEAAPPHVPPSNPLEEFLVGLWREVLRVDHVGVEDNFFELGGNSIQAAMMINRLQDKLGERVSTVAMFDAPTIASFVRNLVQAFPEAISRVFGQELPGAGDMPASAAGATALDRSSALDSLVVPLQPDGSRPPFFVVHPPGGIVVCYQLLAQHLGREQPTYGVRARGLHGESELPTSLQDMAAEYVRAIRAVQPMGPYHLGGWSMGGVVAYEMAQQLRAQGQSVGLLALLDTIIPYNSANKDCAEGPNQSGREYGLDVTMEELDRLGPNEQLPYLWQHVRKLGLVDEDTPPALVGQILDDLKRLFHAHLVLANDYAIRPYPGRITLFRPAEAPVVVPTSADRNWGKRAAAVEVHFVPGQHHSMVKEPHVRVLAEKLAACLQAATRA